MHKSISTLFFLAFLISAFIFLGKPASATHYRAGEIFYRNTSFLTYEVTVITYTTTNAGLGVDRPQIEIFWGDGTIDTINRINGPISGITNLPDGENLGNNIKKNVYVGSHIYPGPLPFYVISINDPNRVSNIRNMLNSVSVEFYVEDTLRIFDPAFVGLNSSPILLNPPIDNANVGETFFHNPAAFDPDGDSLTFQLVTPLRAQGAFVPGYQLPDLINPGIDNDFMINSETGEIIWEVPKEQGIYNVAILVREFREGNFIGSVLRDMQIFVDSRDNRPPVIEEIRDTCIVAGNPLIVPVFASDPDVGQNVTIEAFGGPLELNVSPAVFTGGTALGSVSGLFEWQTVCEHIRPSFYQIVFKATDNFSPPGQNSVPLTFLETWIIKVVAPAPENLTASAIDEQIILNWNNPYACDSVATRKFNGFSVWRREGSNPFPIDTCNPGLDGRGYTKIADTLRAFTFIDSTVIKGKSYCYRVLANFVERTPLGLVFNKAESLPSNEACSELKRDVPLLENVDVKITDDINGEIFVRWFKPIASPNHLDTLQFPGPYRFELMKNSGFTIANPILLASFSSPSFQDLNDTVFSDTGINTVNTPFVYHVNFYADNGNILVGSSPASSSVFLTVGIGDNQLNLSWEEEVTWQNTKYFIFRKAENELSFSLLDSTLINEFVDANLPNDSLFCYFIRSKGAYTLSSLSNIEIINHSQEVCAIASDTASPCPPILFVSNRCNQLNDEISCDLGDESFQNNLKWSRYQIGCEEDIASFNIYFAMPDDTGFSLIANVIDTNFSHTLEQSLAGCYFVTAIDSSGNESNPSQTICVDNCPCYILPNVFTPNNDGSNDLYTPILPFRFVDRVEMKIYNRWGNLVFETEDPMINWDGKDKNSGKNVKEGVYFYVCKVFELRADGVRPSSDQRNGFIHLIRGNGNTN